MKRSGSGVHVFELAFEHTVDILNTEFRCADVLPFAWTHTWQSITPVTLLNLLLLLQMLTNISDIWWLVCHLTLQCCRRISLKSNVVCQSYGNVYRVTVFLVDTVYFYVLLCYAIEIVTCSVYCIACQRHNVPFAAFFNKSGPRSVKAVQIKRERLWRKVSMKQMSLKSEIKGWRSEIQNNSV